eukprot:3078279-Lingulodinium_polyedra.AAC.1
MLSTPTDSAASIEQHPEEGVDQTIVQVKNPRFYNINVIGLIIEAAARIALVATLCRVTGTCLQCPPWDPAGSTSFRT